MVAQGHLMSAARHAMLCRNSFIFPGLFTHLTFYKHEPTLLLSGIANVLSSGAPQRHNTILHRSDQVETSPAW